MKSPRLMLNLRNERLGKLDVLELLLLGMPKPNYCSVPRWNAMCSHILRENKELLYWKKDEKKK